MVDEYLSSQVCNNCKKRNVENVVQRSAKRRVLQCQETACNIIWNRDIMVAKNILNIFLHEARNNDARLSPFQRSESKE
ncbi:hypothetical protein BD408DRAFT_71311 [Parasitella parasitica]|nr:hypothetical protein BD408DRAFT_71311 [Parasitella parasitica]